MCVYVYRGICVCSYSEDRKVPSTVLQTYTNASL